MSRPLPSLIGYPLSLPTRHLPTLHLPFPGSSSQTSSTITNQIAKSVQHDEANRQPVRARKITPPIIKGYVPIDQRPLPPITNFKPCQSGYGSELSDTSVSDGQSSGNQAGSEAVFRVSVGRGSKNDKTMGGDKAVGFEGDMGQAGQSDWDLSGSVSTSGDVQPGFDLHAASHQARALTNHPIYQLHPTHLIIDPNRQSSSSSAYFNTNLPSDPFAYPPLPPQISAPSLSTQPRSFPVTSAQLPPDLSLGTYRAPYSQSYPLHNYGSASQPAIAIPQPISPHHLSPQTNLESSYGPIFSLQHLPTSTHLESHNLPQTPIIPSQTTSSMPPPSTAHHRRAPNLLPTSQSTLSAPSRRSRIPTPLTIPTFSHPSRPSINKSQPLSYLPTPTTQSFLYSYPPTSTAVPSANLITSSTAKSVQIKVGPSYYTCNEPIPAPYPFTPLEPTFSYTSSYLPFNSDFSSSFPPSAADAPYGMTSDSMAGYTTHPDQTIPRDQYHYQYQQDQPQISSPYPYLPDSTSIPVDWSDLCILGTSINRNHTNQRQYLTNQIDERQSEISNPFLHTPPNQPSISTFDPPATELSTLHASYLQQNPYPIYRPFVPSLQPPSASETQSDPITLSLASPLTLRFPLESTSTDPVKSLSKSNLKGKSKSGTKSKSSSKIPPSLIRPPSLAPPTPSPDLRPAVYVFPEAYEFAHLIDDESVLRRPKRTRRSTRGRDVEVKIAEIVSIAVSHSTSYESEEYTARRGSRKGQSRS